MSDTSTCMHKVGQKHQWQGKIYKHVATRSFILANRAASTSFKTLHKAGKMLRIHMLVELDWLGLSRGYLYFCKRCSLMIFWTLKFIISLNQYIFLLLKSWYIVYSCIFGNVIFYVVVISIQARRMRPSIYILTLFISTSCFKLWHQFRIQTKK